MREYKTKRRSHRRSVTLQHYKYLLHEWEETRMVLWGTTKGGKASPFSMNKVNPGTVGHNHSLTFKFIEVNIGSTTDSHNIARTTLNISSAFAPVLRTILVTCRSSREDSGKSLSFSPRACNSDCAMGPNEGIQAI